MRIACSQNIILIGQDFGTLKLFNTTAFGPLVLDICNSMQFLCLSRHEDQGVRLDFKNIQNDPDQKTNTTAQVPFLVFKVD